MKFIKNNIPSFIPTILIIILILIFSSCSSVNTSKTYETNDKPYTTTYYGNVEVKDMMLLLDRCNLTYTNYDNYINTRLIGSIINEESPTKSHNVAYTCIINYKVEKNKLVINVYDLKEMESGSRNGRSDIYAKFLIDNFEQFSNKSIASIKKNFSRLPKDYPF